MVNEMNRWDFDCQKCETGIGDAYYVDPTWYRCSQDKDEYKLLQSVYPRFKFDDNGNFVSGDFPSNIKEDHKYHLIDGMKEDIVSCISNKKDLAVFAYFGYTIDVANREVIWHCRDNEDEYRKACGITEHHIKGSGRGRVGYCFCKNCAEDLNYICPICGNKLVEIQAKDHPGGNGWGIRGQREPSPMTW